MGRKPAADPLDAILGGRPEPTALAYTRLDAHAAMPDNPRTAHKVTALADSIRAYGFGQPVTVNRTTGNVLAGNGRLRALRKIEQAGEPAPAGIAIDSSGRWTVPTLYGDWPAEDEGKVALALNGGIDGSLEGELEKDIVADILRGAGDAEILGLGLSEAKVGQFLADYETPLAPPTLDLTGIETVSQAGDEEHVSLKLLLPATIADRFRRLTASGIAAKTLIMEGITKHERKAAKPRPNERRRRTPPATKGKR